MMASSEQLRRRIRDALIERERAIFMEMMQDALAEMTLGELGEILAGPAGRSVADLPVRALIGLAVAPTPTPRRTRSARAARVRSTEATEPATVSAPGAEAVAPADRAEEPAPAAEPTGAPAVEPAGEPVDHAALIRDVVASELARQRRADPEAAVVAALAGVGAWIGARDLRGRVALPPDALRATLNRLVKAGAVQRAGAGPGTVYRVDPVA